MKKGWTARRIKHLQELAGTAGKQPSEPPIVSMGSTGPPLVEDPVFIRDHIISDGAQVTRPSIDPYREPVETHVYLCGGELRMSMPLAIKISPNSPQHFKEAVVKACFCMGVLAFVPWPNGLEKFGEAMVVDVSNAGSGFFAGYYTGLEVKRMNRPVFVQAPVSDDFSWLHSIYKDVSAVVLDEDLGSYVPLEIGVSLLDRELRRLGLRNDVSVLAGGESIRGSDDIFKLVALGADAVVVSRAVEHALEPLIKQGAAVLQEKAENLLLGFQREVKLLAGAAGLSSVFNTLIGNRELLRAVELKRDVRQLLGVKLAGEG